MNENFTRRSVRQYLDKPVEEHKLQQLLAAAMQAPSANNQQPWEFIVVQDREQLKQLSGYSPYARMMAKASVAIVVLGDTRRMMIPQQWQQDLGAATQNILLEAVTQNLGAVWLGAYGNDRAVAWLNRFFNLPDYAIPYSVISIGYPAKEDANHFTDRYDPSRIHYEQY